MWRMCKIARLCSRKLMKIGDVRQSSVSFNITFSVKSLTSPSFEISRTGRTGGLWYPEIANVVSWHIESKCWNPTRHKNSDLSDLSIWKNINVTTSLFSLVQIQTWASWQTYWYWFHLIFEEVSQWTFLNKWESGECSARGWWGSGSKYTDSCHPYLTGRIVACFLP